jgi:hypothetical protein
VASSQTSVDPKLAVLGAALCHTDGRSGVPGPIDTTTCERCDLCAVATHVVLAPGLTAAALARPSLSVVRLPTLFALAARPRAPPLGANSPRAPPAV